MVRKINFSSLCTFLLIIIPCIAATTLPTKAERLSADILIEVEGRRLTKADAEKTAINILMLYTGNTDKELLKSRAQTMLNSAVENFINSILIEKELKQRNITINSEEEIKEIARIKAELPINKAENAQEEKTIQGIARNKLGAEKLLKTFGIQTSISEKEIDDFCKNNPVPENVHARHILIKFSTEDSKSTKRQRKEKLERIRKRIIKGENFETLAREHSDCPSRDNGGDLGTFKRGQMLETFEKAAFKQKEDEVGPVIETNAGYHIIQVLKHIKEESIPRARVARYLKTQKHQDALGELTGILKKKASIKDYRQADPNPGL